MPDRPIADPLGPFGDPPPLPEPPRSSRRTPLMPAPERTHPRLRTLAVVSVIIGALVICWLLVASHRDRPAQAPGAGPESTSPQQSVPADTGTASLGELRAACAAGDSAGCDMLYQDSPLGSSDEDFGRTCGGRHPVHTDTCVAMEDGD